MTPGNTIGQGLMLRYVIEATFIEAAPLQGSKEGFEMLTTNFNTLAINYLGAGTYYAGILGFKPDTPEYIQWVKDSMTFMILPRLRELLGADDNP